MKNTEFCEYPEFEVDNIPVSESDAYCYPQSIIDALDEPVGNSFDEVVEDLVSPVFQCGNKLCQIFIACTFGL